MAIVFIKDISTTNLLLAYTNNVVQFNSDSVLIPTKATITIGSSVKTLYPHPGKSFYFNFKEWVTSIINTDNFKDDVNLDIDGAGYVYDWSKIYLNSDIVFAITLSDANVETATRNTKFLSATMQLDTYKLKYPINSSLDHPVILSPYEIATNNTAYLKHWEGYPFDITIYTGNATTLKISNLSNLLNYTLNVSNKVNRIALSDGNTTATIQDALPLMDGLNSLKFTANSLDYFATLDKIDEKCAGHYVKWMNDLGGFNYWLFPNGNRNRKTKDLGEINNDYSNFEDTISPTIQMGKTANDVIQVASDVLTEQENLLLSGILDSPKIYLFTGQPFAKAGVNDWMEVSISGSDYRISNAKQSQNKINITFELPQRNTRTI